MTAGNGAGHHGGHGMAAIHGIRWGSGRFVVMMLGNGALTRSAAGRLVGSPSGASKGGIEQNDDEQTDACVDCAAAMLERGLHVLRQLESLPQHYSVTRHSLQV